MENRSGWLERFCDPGTTVEVRRCHRYSAPKTWRFRRRIIEDHVLYFVLSGQILAQIDGREQRWFAGQVCWLSPNVVQEGRPADIERLQFFVLRLTITDAEGHLISAPEPCLRPAISGSILYALDDCADLVRVAGPFQEQRLRYRLADCFAQIFAAEHGDQAHAGLSHEQRRSMASESRWPRSKASDASCTGDNRR
jgi:mannose-6-phosphate isomerase-like protein (cupin superfamily)